MENKENERCGECGHYYEEEQGKKYGNCIIERKWVSEITWKEHTEHLGAGRVNYNSKYRFDGDDPYNNNSKWFPKKK
jgi:hypothetical protein